MNLPININDLLAPGKIEWERLEFGVGIPDKVELPIQPKFLKKEKQATEVRAESRAELGAELGVESGAESEIVVKMLNSGS